MPWMQAKDKWHQLQKKYRYVVRDKFDYYIQDPHDKNINTYRLDLVSIVNEMLLLKRILDLNDVTDVIYEEQLEKTDKRFDFTVLLNDNSKIYVEVKTIQSNFLADEIMDRKRKEYEESQNIISGSLIYEGEFKGQFWHNAISSRSKFLDYVFEIEEKIQESEVKIDNSKVFAIFCGNGFDWHQSDLEDFVYEYKTGRYSSWDHFSKMQKYSLKNDKKYNNKKLLRNIDDFYCFIRKAHEINGKFVGNIRGFP